MRPALAVGVPKAEAVRVATRRLLLAPRARWVAPLALDLVQSPWARPRKEIAQTQTSRTVRIEDRAAFGAEGFEFFFGECIGTAYG